MIYLFSGSDSEKVRSKAFAFVEAARKKQPGLYYRRLAREEVSAAALEDAASAGGLFVSRLLILLDDPFATARKNVDEEESEEHTSAAGALVEKYLERLRESDNAIVLLAPKLASARLKKIAKRAAKAYEFNERARLPAGRQGFNTALVGALAARDRGKLWLEINRAGLAGDAPEAVHGLLHWKARDLIARPARAWEPGEARALSLDLISLLMRTRRSGTDLSLALERFALSI